jgi:hypothetical protein
MPDSNPDLEEELEGDGAEDDAESAIAGGSDRLAY